MGMILARGSSNKCDHHITEKTESAILLDENATGGNIIVAQCSLCGKRELLRGTIIKDGEVYEVDPEDGSPRNYLGDEIE